MPTTLQRHPTSTSTAPRRRALDVIKVGGAVLADPARLAELSEHVARATQAERDVILVHGGGELIARLHDDLGLETVKHGGLRATPPESMEVVAMALRGVRNVSLVAELVERGVPALGVSGADLGLLRSKLLNERRLGRVGGPPRVRASQLRQLLDAGLVPVVAPVCLGPDGGLLNVNADTVAHAIACALGAHSLDFVSDVPGVFDAQGEVIERIHVDELSGLLEGSEIRGGMIPKLQASHSAVRSGVARVRIGTLASLGSEAATEISGGDQ